MERKLIESSKWIAGESKGISNKNNVNLMLGWSGVTRYHLKVHMWLWKVSETSWSKLETKDYLLPSFLQRQWVWPLPTPTLSLGLWATQVIMVCLLTTETASFNQAQSSLLLYLSYILGIVFVCALSAYEHYQTHSEVLHWSEPLYSGPGSEIQFCVM